MAGKKVLKTAEQKVWKMVDKLEFSREHWWV
jgi:hypothetical protein